MSTRAPSEPELTDEKLERVFREIEEASERRAIEEEESSHPGPLESLTRVPSAVKQHRRQSISISRVGSFPEVQPEYIPSHAASPLPWTGPTPMYNVGSQVGASTSSFEVDSGSSFTSGSAYDTQLDDEEIHHTTQKETIVGRRNTLTKAVSSAFAKTLTRIRSRGALNEMDPADTGSSVIIGVVHEATTTVKAAEADMIAENESGVAPDSGMQADLAPSRRMSMTITAEISAAAPISTSRSRSGSIIKLRSKRSQTNDVKTSQPQLPSEPMPGDNSGSGDNAGLDTLFVPAVAAADSSNTKGLSQKQSRRLSQLAKTLAQKLRRSLSSDNSTMLASLVKDKEKEKGKGTAEQKVSKAQPTIAAEDSLSKRQKPPPPLTPPLPSVRVDEAVSASKSPTVEVAAGIPLPPSPSFTSYPPPFSPAFPGVISAAMIPLPPSPVTSITPQSRQSQAEGATGNVAEGAEEGAEDDAVSVKSGAPTEMVEGAITPRASEIASTIERLTIDETTEASDIDGSIPTP